MHDTKESWLNFRLPVDAVLLLGPTGVGKSPLGELIGSNGLLGKKCHHLDFGSELRRAISGGSFSARYSLDELEFIDGVLKRGLLLENEHFSLAQKVILLFLDRVNFFPEQVLVLNGIPRHEGQAKHMERIIRMRALVVLECSAQQIYSRIRDNVGGDRTERTDDSVDLIEKKLKIFAERTNPLVEHYEKKGAKIYRVTVSEVMSPVQVFEAVSSLASAYPPVSLVTEPPEG